MRIGRWMLMGALLLPLHVYAEGPPSRAEIEEERAALFTQADIDGNGMLSLDEFTAFESLVRDKMTEHRFNHLDANGDGALSLDELQADRPGRGPGRHRPPWDR